jgi:uncharacterized protein (DUF2062 family)
MLFKRRLPQSYWQKIGNIVWPKMGLKRLANYYKHRTIRIPAGEHSIAAGLAFGCAVSWTPTFGTHLLQCALFCWITRTNWIASFIGSGFGNPWTTPMMMLIAYHVGKALFVATGYGDMVLHTNDPITLELLMNEKMKIFLPTLLGGYVMGAATFPLLYYPFYYMVKGARLARKARIQRIVHKEAIEVTGQTR